MAAPPVCRVIRGPNGSGKTRLLQEIYDSASAQTPASRLGQLRQTRLRPIVSSRVSTILEAPLVYSGATLSAARRKTGELLERFRLSDIYSRQYRYLSGGERQTLHLLVALIKERGALLDDPFSMLDQERRSMFLRILQEYHGLGREFVITLLRPVELGLSISEMSLQGKATGHSPALDNRFTGWQAGAPMARLNDVQLRVGRRVLVDHATLSINAGCLNLLLGHNGVGKSVLLRAIRGRTKPTKGQLRIEDSRPVILCPQNSEALAGTAPIPWAELIPNRWCEPMLEALREQGILSDSAPSAHSFGERRFISLLLACLAAASSATPGILLLDEPDCSLDDNAMTCLLVALSTLASNGWAIVVATHDPDYYPWMGPLNVWRIVSGQISLEVRDAPISH